MGTESRVQGDLSTTGGLGDNEGMDTTMGHADPEAMDTSLDMRNTEPKTQRPDSRKKRRLEITQTNTEIEETLEGKKEIEQKPSKGREEVKPLDAAAENTTTTVAEELEGLKDQHKLQMEESAISTLTESRVQGDLSTTGGLGDNEGMDTTIGHADPEVMDTSLDMRNPEPKRRMEIR